MEGRWNCWQYKSDYQKRPQSWSCSQILKNTFTQVNQNNDVSGILPKKPWVGMSFIHSKLSRQHELFESDTSKLCSMLIKEDKFQPISEDMELPFVDAIHQNIQAVLQDQNPKMPAILRSVISRYYTTGEALGHLKAQNGSWTSSLLRNTVCKAVVRHLPQTKGMGYPCHLWRPRSLQ